MIGRRPATDASHIAGDIFQNVLDHALIFVCVRGHIKMSADGLRQVDVVSCSVVSDI